MDECFGICKSDQILLLQIARSGIEYYLTFNKKPDVDFIKVNENLKTESGVFVTLTKNGNLRGCIGRLTGELSLYENVQEMAIASATKDYRFDRVELSEMKDIMIEISVLSPLKKISEINEIVLGRHGILIKKGMQTGTFLPQVAVHTGWCLEEFLCHCARDKAKIGWFGWKNAEIFTYEAFVFNERV